MVLAVDSNVEMKAGVSCWEGLSIVSSRSGQHRPGILCYGQRQPSKLAASTRSSEVVACFPRFIVNGCGVQWEGRCLAGMDKRYMGDQRIEVSSIVRTTGRLSCMALRALS